MATALKELIVTWEKGTTTKIRELKCSRWGEGRDNQFYQGLSFRKSFRAKRKPDGCPSRGEGFCQVCKGGKGMQMEGAVWEHAKEKELWNRIVCSATASSLVCREHRVGSAARPGEDWRGTCGLDCVFPGSEHFTVGDSKHVLTVRPMEEYRTIDPLFEHRVMEY